MIIEPCAVIVLRKVSDQCWCVGWIDIAVGAVIVVPNKHADDVSTT